MIKKTRVFPNSYKLDKPQVIGLVITKMNNKVNLCPVIWQAVSSNYEQPMVVCIGLSNHHYTLENILKTKEFVYSYPNKDQKKDVEFCGSISGNEINKLDKIDLKFKNSENLKTPLLVDAVINYECELLKTFKLETFTIVVGKIIKIHSSKYSSFDKLYSLGGNMYGIIKEMEIMI